jgi:hypothetical protein
MTEGLLLLHGNGIDDVLVLGAASYLLVMFGLSRIKAARIRRAKAEHKLAHAQAQLAASVQAQTTLQDETPVLDSNSLSENQLPTLEVEANPTQKTE